MTWFFPLAQWKKKGKEMSYPLQDLLLKLGTSFQLFGEPVPAAASATTPAKKNSEVKTMFTLWSASCNLNDALVIVTWQWMKLKFGKSYHYWSVRAVKRKYKQIAQQKAGVSRTSLISPHVPQHNRTQLWLKIKSGLNTLKSSVTLIIGTVIFCFLFAI